MAHMNRRSFLVVLVTFLTFALSVGTAPLQAADPRNPDPNVAIPEAATPMQLPSERPENRKVIKALQAKTVSFEFQDSPVAEVLGYLGQVGKVNIALDKARMPDPTQKINLKVIEVSLETALKLLTRQIGMKYVVRDGVVLISDEEGVRAPDKKKEKTGVTKAENRKVIEILQAKTVSFEFQDSPVAEVLGYLGQVGGVNIILDADKMPDPARKINLKLTDVSLETALKFLTEQIGMKYVVRDGVVFISDEDGVMLPPETAVYDVRDLLKPTGVQPTARESTTSEALHELIEVIKDTVEPGTWEEGSGNAIRGVTIKGLLVVSHVPEVHVKVQELLEKLRRARAVKPERAR